MFIKMCIRMFTSGDAETNLLMHVLLLTTTSFSPYLASELLSHRICLFLLLINIAFKRTNINSHFHEESVSVVPYLHILYLINTRYHKILKLQGKGIIVFFIAFKVVFPWLILQLSVFHIFISHLYFLCCELPISVPFHFKILSFSCSRKYFSSLIFLPGNLNDFHG